MEDMDEPTSPRLECTSGEEIVQGSEKQGGDLGERPGRLGPDSDSGVRLELS